MNKVRIDQDRCKGCGLCSLYCPRKILVLDGGINAGGYHPARITDAERCISCLNCYLVCPDGCYQVYQEAFIAR